MSLENFIKLDYKLLPVIKNVKPEKFANIEWQTESIQTMLAEYTITEKGLILNNFLNNKFEDVNFHGIIHFYSQDSEIKNEFKAKYTDGKLMSIIEVLDKKSKHWNKT